MDSHSIEKNYSSVLPKNHVFLSSTADPSSYSTGGQSSFTMDEATEKSKLQDKISKVESNIKYYEGQVMAANWDFREVLSTKTSHENNGTIAEWQREYNLVDSALKDSNTNLQSEKRMLNILKAKLETGDYAMSNTSTAAKRKFIDGAMSNSSTEAKRKFTD